MLQQAIVILLLTMALSQAKVNKGAMLPLKLQLAPLFQTRVDEKIIGGAEVTPYSIPYQVSVNFY
jgi:hypothetical protein